MRAVDLQIIEANIFWIVVPIEKKIFKMYNVTMVATIRRILRRR